MPRRLTLVRELVRASAHSMLRNVAYYSRRKSGAAEASAAETEPTGEIGDLAALPPGIPSDPLLEAAIDESVADAPTGSGMENSRESAAEGASDPLAAGAAADPLWVSVDFAEEAEPLRDLYRTISRLAEQIEGKEAVNDLRGIEGKMRERYYQAWRHILKEGWTFSRRVRRPPDNEVNALISFGNSVLYTVCLSEIYRTQLTPTISYLHEPGARRFSLALDLSEIFKPLLVDRAIFRLVNTGQLNASHFDRSLESCYLTDAGKRLFLAALEERMGATIKHRRLGRHVSYRHLIRLECYKLIRHLTELEPYRAFRAWW